MMIVKTCRPHASALYSPLAALLVVALLSVTAACDGMFDGIYDDPVSEEETLVYDVTLSDNGYGFIAYDQSTHRGTLYVNSTDYYTWTYFDFHTFTTDTLTIDLDAADILADEPTDWDLALHRWDTRTNGGAVLETDYTSLDDLEAAGSIPTGNYVEDVWYEYVSVDMSGMMTGDIGYMSCYVNLELAKWMDVDTDNPPPVYTPSGKVYMLRLSDGTYVALILSSYMNSSGTKGYLTIDFIYPFS